MSHRQKALRPVPSASSGRSVTRPDNCHPGRSSTFWKYGKCLSKVPHVPHRLVKPAGETVLVRTAIILRMLLLSLLKGDSREFSLNLDAVNSGNVRSATYGLSVNDASVVREQPGLGAIRAFKLVEHPRHITLDRGFRQVQPRGDLRIRQALAEAGQHLGLPLGQ
jgi:hypothetical protein